MVMYKRQTLKSFRLPSKIRGKIVKFLILNRLKDDQATIYALMQYLQNTYKRTALLYYIEQLLNDELITKVSIYPVIYEITEAGKQEMKRLRAELIDWLVARNEKLRKAKGKDMTLLKLLKNAFNFNFFEKFNIYDKRRLHNILYSFYISNLTKELKTEINKDLHFTFNKQNKMLIRKYKKICRRFNKPVTVMIYTTTGKLHVRIGNIDIPLYGRTYEEIMEDVNKATLMINCALREILLKLIRKGAIIINEATGEIITEQNLNKFLSDFTSKKIKSTFEDAIRLTRKGTKYYKLKGLEDEEVQRIREKGGVVVEDVEAKDVLGFGKGEPTKIYVDYSHSKLKAKMEIESNSRHYVDLLLVQPLMIEKMNKEIEALQKQMMELQNLMLSQINQLSQTIMQQQKQFLDFQQSMLQQHNILNLAVTNLLKSQTVIAQGQQEIMKSLTTLTSQITMLTKSLLDKNNNDGKPT